MKLVVAILPSVIVLAAHGQTPAPGTIESKAIVARMHEAALAYADCLQDFTCTRFLTRSAGSLLDGPHWRRLDTQEAVIAYVDHTEHADIVKVNGETVDLAKHIKRGPYFTPGGEFGGMLQKIFDRKAQAEFQWDHDEASSGLRTCVFRYNVPQATSTEIIQADADRVRLGHHGMVWADCLTGAVIRFRIETDIGESARSGRRVPVGFRIEVRYAPVTIGTQEFLLPQSAVETSLFDKTWTKLEIRFEQYRKFDANSVIKLGEDKD
jgi:hypothetical protein